MDTSDIIIATFGCASLTLLIWGKLIVPNLIWSLPGTDREEIWDYIWPFPERRRRVFYSALDFWPKDCRTVDEGMLMWTAQEMVDNRLRRLARDLDLAFQRQEAARRSGDQQVWNSTTAYYKGRFWGAWKAANDLGFQMKETYRANAMADEHPCRVNYGYSRQPK
ncbi:MAG: hypothetical protein WD231_04925 [Candidatus Woykebacteria bacterium]